MPKRIIYENNSGGVSIVVPAGIENYEQLIGRKTKVIDDFIKSLEGQNPTDKEWVDFVAEKDVPIRKAFEIVDTTAISSDRTFRNAWKKNGSIIEVDMPRARIIHMDRIRRVRDEELDKSDKEFIQGLEDGGNLTTIKARRKKLRDIPQDFDLESVNTPDELKTLWPDDLPQPQV